VGSGEEITKAIAYQFYNCYVSLVLRVRVYLVGMETLTLTGVGWCVNRLEYWARPITEGRDSNYIGNNPKP
jgi:hypothetical protein